MNLVAEGLSISSLPEQEGKFVEGEKGELRLYLKSALDPVQMNFLTETLLQRGVAVHEVSQVSRVLTIRFQRATAPLEPIVKVVSTSGLDIKVVGWQLFKTPAVPLWVWGLGAGLLLYLVVKSG